MSCAYAFLHSHFGSSLAIYSHQALRFIRTQLYIGIEAALLSTMVVLSMEFIAEFRAILSHRSSKPVNTIFKEAMECLDKHHLSYKVSKIHNKFMFVHNKNRGGLGLSPHNCHRNAAKIDKVGCDVDMLVNAICVQIAPKGPMMTELVAFNEKLIDRSNGYLSPVSGCELYASLGCGHTAAFAKAAWSKSKTPEKDLQDAYGNINTSALCANPNWREMIEVGWDWIVIPWQIDEMFPEFAVIAQAACNASNNVASLMSELEVAVNFASSVEDQSLKDDPEWESKVCGSITSLCAPCAPYAAKILAYAQKYGGGKDAHLIAFMDDVAKKYGCNVIMGETWWSCIADAKFCTKGQEYPLIRTALNLGNLTGDVVTDGIARTFSVNDIKKICIAKCAKSVDDFNNMLNDARIIGKTMVIRDVVCSYV